MVFDFKENAYEGYIFPDERKNLIDLALGAFRSIRFPVAYVSMPISSGKLLYDVLEKKGCRTLDELASVDKDAIYNEIIAPNIEMGICAADKIRTSLPPLAPSVFEGKKFRWSQQEYMALWYKVIEERAREMHMTDGWEYSNGGVQEFTRAMMMHHKTPWWDGERFQALPGEDYAKVIEDMSKIKIYDINGKPLFLEKGYGMIENAVSDLGKRGFDASSLKESKKSLQNVLGLINDPFTTREEYNYLNGQNVSSEMFYLNC